MNEPPPAGGGGVAGVPDDAAPHRQDESQPSDALLSRADAARYLQIAARTIHRWALSGRVRFTTTKGGCMRFARVDLDAARVAPPPESPATGRKRLG